MEATGPSSLPANAFLIPSAENLARDPARGWYFTVLVRGAIARLGNNDQNSPHPL